MCIEREIYIERDIIDQGWHWRHQEKDRADRSRQAYHSEEQGETIPTTITTATTTTTTINYYFYYYCSRSSSSSKS